MLSHSMSELNMPRRRKQKDIMDKSWTCLSSLKAFFETSGQEVVVEYDGFQLVTKKHIYMLYDGLLTRKDR